LGGCWARWRTTRASWGLGIDEDTAMVLENDAFSVIGSGAVYIVNGDTVSYSNIAEEKRERPLTMFDVRLHVLSQGDSFDLKTRKPSCGPFRQA
jgi:cyanophycinase